MGSSYYMTYAHYGKSLLYDINGAAYYMGPLWEELII